MQVDWLWQVVNESNCDVVCLGGGGNGALLFLEEDGEWAGKHKKNTQNRENYMRQCVFMNKQSDIRTQRLKVKKESKIDRENPAPYDSLAGPGPGLVSVIILWLVSFPPDALVDVIGPCMSSFPVFAARSAGGGAGGGGSSVAAKTGAPIWSVMTRSTKTITLTISTTK